jgi:hypothetical protein
MKSLTLSPTKSPGVFSIMLSDGFSQKVIGQYNEANCTFTTRRNEARHLHLKSGSLAVNKMVLEIPGLKWIEIIFTHNDGKVQSLKTSKDYLLAHGTKVAYAATSYESQYFLPKNLFSLELAQRYESEINSQPSLFPGVACG